jgi:hypothetical protein
MTNGQPPSFNRRMEMSPNETDRPAASATRRAGIVLPFPSPAERRRATTEPPSEPGRVLRQLVERQDASQNAAWDRFAALVERAWVWRDPESIVDIEACLDGLKRRLLTFG